MNDKDITIQEKKAMIFEEVLDKMYDLYLKKNSDYSSGDKSSFEEGWEDFGITSVAVRLNDKVNRLKHFAKKGSLNVTTESIEETLIDNAIYSVLALVEIQYEREKS